MKFQIIATTALFAALSIAGPLNFSPAEANNNLAARDEEALPKDLELALELALTEITAIPDEVLLKGDEATNDWLIEHGLRDNDPTDEDEDNGTPVNARSEEVTSLSLFERDDLDARGVVQVAKCIAAISKVIISTAIPAAKILRIKRYLQLLGGVRKTVLLLVRAKTTAQRLKLGGRALVNIANELFGIQSIKNNCSKL